MHFCIFKTLLKLNIIERYSGFNLNKLKVYFKKIAGNSGTIVLLQDLKENNLRFWKDDIISSEEKMEHWLVF